MPFVLCSHPNRRNAGRNAAWHGEDFPGPRDHGRHAEAKGHAGKRLNPEPQTPNGVLECHTNCKMLSVDPMLSKDEQRNSNSQRMPIRYFSTLLGAATLQIGRLDLESPT